MNFRRTFVLGIVVLAGLTSLARGDENEPKDVAAAAVEKPSQEQLEKQFAEELSGVVLTGQFTTQGGAEPEKPAAPEKYTITKVAKLRDNLWMFQARIQYGERDITLPIPLRVEWAGDTPVVTLTDATIPGLGTFTSRVLFYRGRYAGTWQHGEVGGHLFGQYAKIADEPAPETAKEPDPAAAK